MAEDKKHCCLECLNCGQKTKEYYGHDPIVITCLVDNIRQVAELPRICKNMRLKNPDNTEVKVEKKPTTRKRVSISKKHYK